MRARGSGKAASEAEIQRTAPPRLQGGFVEIAAKLADLDPFACAASDYVID